MDMILDMGGEVHYNHRIDSLKELLDKEEFDAVFVGTGAPNGKELEDQYPRTITLTFSVEPKTIRWGLQRGGKLVAS